MYNPNMNCPKSSYTFSGIEVTMTWIKDDDLSKYSPVTQVYGIVFNDKGEILVARETPEGKWQLPGGKPEENETVEETVKRELLEEVDVKARKIYPLGAQKTEMLNNPNKDEGDLFYQLRCVVELDKLLPQTPDPDRGNVWERMFVPANKIAEHIKWGETGNAMFKDAIALWEKTNKINVN